MQSLYAPLIIEQLPKHLQNDNIFTYMLDSPHSPYIPRKYLTNYKTIFDHNGRTPLMYAVILNNIHFVQYLVQYDAGYVDNYGDTARSIACKLYKNNNCIILHEIINILERYEITTDSQTFINLDDLLS